LLLIIFKLVYKQETRKKKKNIKPDSLYSWRKVDLRSPALFPYAIAAVCSLWRDVASMVPEFWTRVVVLVDSPTTPLPAVVSQLSWSRDLSLDITITTWAGNDPTDGRQERVHIKSIMKVLNPHMHRLRQLIFNVKFSSSLPSFPDDFHGTANLLRNLRLLCREDDGGDTEADDDTEPTNPTQHEAFACPKLSMLTIDGRNCYNNCMTDASWIDKIPIASYLTIAHFKPQPGESFSYDQFLPLLARMKGTKLRFLHLTNLGLDLPADAFIRRNPGDLEGCLEFEDIHDFRLIVEVLRIVLGASEVKLTRCSIGAAGDFVAKGFEVHGDLTLREIGCDQDLLPLLSGYLGSTLVIQKRPSFNGPVLDMMCISEKGKFVCAPRLAFLSIEITEHISLPPR
jgi:hypothetical protein